MGHQDVIRPIPQPPGGSPPARASCGETEPVVSAAARARWDGAPWVLSAAGETALRAYATRLADALPVVSHLDVAFTLAAGRAAQECRAVVRGGDVPALRALSEGRSHPGVRRSAGRRRAQPAFVFTGQGSQRLGMARDLAAAFPPFAHAYAEVCAAFDPHLGRPLREVLDGTDADLLNDTAYAQPALFAFEAALYALYRACGVRPDHLAGHSIGELVAAYAAGVLSLPDAALLVAARGRLMSALPAGGAMVAVRATAAEVEKLLAESGGPVALAVVNGPESVVLSGPAAAVDDLVARLGRRHDRLRVSHAFHSSLLDPMLEDFRAVASSVTYHPPAVPVVSGLTGEPDPAAMVTAEYWVRHARGTVRYAEAVSWLEAAGTSAFVEIGPEAVLSTLTARCLSSEAVVVPGTGGVAGMLDALAVLHVQGVEIDWPVAYAGSGARRCVSVPSV
jgi:acyl transferase domain-containing protein